MPRWFVLSARVASAIITIAIILFSLLPQQRVSDVIRIFPLRDIGAHAVAYCAFGCSWFATFIHYDGSKHKYSTIIVSFIVVLCGISLGFALELLQPLFGRSAEFKDLVADSIGVVTGVAVAYGFTTWYVKNRGEKK